MTIECRCKTEIVLDMSVQVTDLDATPNPAVAVVTPKDCPFCKTPLPLSPQVIDSFRNFYQSKKDAVPKTHE